jgi:hypothetical protein
LVGALKLFLFMANRKLQSLLGVWHNDTNNSWSASLQMSYGVKIGMHNTSSTIQPRYHLLR